LEVTNAGSKFSGGSTKFTFGIAPLGQDAVRPTGRLEASYSGLDLSQLSDFYGLAGLRMAGRASGRNLLEWPMGRFDEHRGGGEVGVAVPAGAVPMTASLEEARAADRDHSRHQWGPF